MEYYVAIGVISALAYMLVVRADNQRKDKEIDNQRLREMLQAHTAASKAVTEANKEAVTSLREMVQADSAARKATSEAELIARDSLRKIAKSRKKKIKELQEQLSEFDAITEAASSEGEDDDDEDEDSSVKTKKGSDTIAGLLLAIQRKMRGARELVEMSETTGKPLDLMQLAHHLDTSITALEEEME